MPYSVMLDAGHGGTDPGAVYNGRQEKEDALALTLAVGEVLQNNGFSGNRADIKVNIPADASGEISFTVIMHIRNVIEIVNHIISSFNTIFG